MSRVLCGFFTTGSVLIHPGTSVCTDRASLGQRHGPVLCASCPLVMLRPPVPKIFLGYSSFYSSLGHSRGSLLYCETFMSLAPMFHAQPIAPTCWILRHAGSMGEHPNIQLSTRPASILPVIVPACQLPPVLGSSSHVSQCHRTGGHGEQNHWARAEHSTSLVNRADFCKHLTSVSPLLCPKGSPCTSLSPVAHNFLTAFLFSVSSHPYPEVFVFSL